ncbi:hypothetical protein [Citrifermentans bemidjiense]|uniref:hypothetical protein n=1 Tax=Citrifermentans bemidjiense TaxID=225194 RepID=UPI0006747765|nr:hypothetical protein [Citrifermentans bemidjiense]
MTGKSCSLTSQEILDTYFLENRARLLEIASFLDRLDRAADAGEARGEYRRRAFEKALALLLEPGGGAHQGDPAPVQRPEQRAHRERVGAQGDRRLGRRKCG